MKEDSIARANRLVIEIRETLAIARLRLVLKMFSPNQPRWPAGQSDGGQWKPAGGAIQVAGKLDQRREAACLEQYEQDSDLCRMSRSRLCWETAMIRRGACIAGDYIPPLQH
jgi:hypothetical protein